jgi:hypothetical protein
MAEANDVRDGRLVLGAVLVVVGIVALGLQLSGVDIDRVLGGSGWTLFVIVPGLALLAAGLVFPQAGLGLSIAGSIVTITGLLLLYQDRYEHYESWAYAWALVAPGGVGIGFVVHGLRTGARDVIATGARIIVVAVAITVVGALFFESVFDRGRIPFDASEAWPVIAVVVGGILVGSGLIRGDRSGSRPG